MANYTENSKARFDYFILETYEAGIELKGFEVKAIKNNRANLAGAFAIVRGGELFLVNANIPPYQQNNTPLDYDSKRTRKLLLKKSEIEEIERKMRSAKLTLVALKLYNKGGLVKVELGLGRGKKKADKRESIKKRETDREIERTLKR